MNSQPPMLQKQTNGLCIASFVIGLFCLIFSWLPIVGFGGIVGLILGVMGMKAATKADQSKGLGLAGFILSIISIVVAIVVSIVAVGVAHEISTNTDLQKAFREGVEEVQKGIDSKKTITIEQQGTEVEIKADVEKPAGSDSDHD